MQNQDSSVQEVQVGESSIPTPSAQIQDLQKSCELPMDVATLQQQIALNDLEKQKILKALKSERAMRKQAEGEKKKLAREKDEVIRSLTSLSQDNHSQEAKFDSKKLLEEKDELVRSLQQQLCKAQRENMEVKRYWSAELNRVSEVWNEHNRSMREYWEKEATYVNLTSANLAASQAELRQVRLEKDNLVAQFTALEARILEYETKLQDKDNKIIQSEAEWTVKLAVLEARTMTELAAKEENFIREDWQNKVCQMEETIKLQTQQNTSLQERHLSLQELQRDSITKEEDLRQQMRQMEENIKPLTDENTDLQVRNLSLQELLKASSEKEEELCLKNGQMEETIKLLTEDNTGLQERLLSLQELQRENSTKEEDLHQMENNIKLLTTEKTDLQARNSSLQELLKASSEKEEELRQKNSQMDETIKLLTQDNTVLQELAQKTDKEKARMKKEEKKATKEEEKRLKKERKEREEREKRQRKEDEKRRKGELKIQKKETAEREKREKKEKEERKKTEKQERKARERRGE